MSPPGVSFGTSQWSDGNKILLNTFMWTKGKNGSFWEKKHLCECVYVWERLEIGGKVKSFILEMRRIAVL